MALADVALKVAIYAIRHHYNGAVGLVLEVKHGYNIRLDLIRAILNGVGRLTRSELSGINGITYIRIILNQIILVKHSILPIRPCLILPLLLPVIIYLPASPARLLTLFLTCNHILVRIRRREALLHSV